MCGVITIRGVSLIASKNGSDFFVSFPAQHGKNGRFFPIGEVGEPLPSEIERLVGVKRASLAVRPTRLKTKQ